MADRKQQILDVAADLLQSRGFGSFSYQDLSERIGITKASLHHHFPSKDALGEALTARYLDRYREALQAIDRTHDDPWDRFDAWTARLAAIARSGDKICPPGRLQSDLIVLPEPMRRGASQIYQMALKWLAGVLAEGRERGAMRFTGTPRDQATLVLAAMQGAIQTARAEGMAKFKTVVRQLRAAMQS